MHLESPYLFPPKTHKIFESIAHTIFDSQNDMETNSTIYTHPFTPHPLSICDPLLGKTTPKKPEE